MSLANYLAKYKPLIDQEIERELTRRGVEVKKINPELVLVLQAMSELSVGGKRLRGLLTILGYELAGGEANSEVIKVAMMMELFHLGLLIQDDVMDRDGKRRGVATIHVRYSDLHLGEAMAILAGDLPLGWGMEILSQLDLPKSIVSEAVGVWGKYTKRVIYGQMLDVMKIADEKILLGILALKSGEYSCVLPLLLGATLAGASEELKQTLVKYGMELGIVFQLRDDWLAEYGESVKTGKPVGNDSREGKRTLATMYGREKMEEAIADHLRKGRLTLQGLTLKVDVMTELLEWVARREN